MTIIIIIFIIVILIYIGKRNTPYQTITPKKTIKEEKPTQVNLSINLKDQVEKWPYPDRNNDIKRHINAINRGLETGDLDLTNLSYVKLIESIRQQNINENGKYDNNLRTIRNEYEEFRNHYQYEYPENFLSPEERKKKKEEEFERNKHIPIYLATFNYEELPKQILKYVDIVKPLSEWYEIGFKPQKEKYGDWKAIKRENRYYEFCDANIEKQSHKISLQTGKRITEKPYYIKALNEQGIPLTEFVAYGEDLECFLKAISYYNMEDFKNCKKEIDHALMLKKTKDYESLKIDVELKLNNEQIVDEQFEKYKFDIASAIHCGEVNDWFRVLIFNKKYEKIILLIYEINAILDDLINGKIKPELYAESSSDWYTYKKEQFNNNLIYILESKGPELLNSEHSIKLLELLLSQYKKNNIGPIEKIADQFAKWNLTGRANILYKNCLVMVEKEDKPRVKKRIENKIKKLKN